MASDTGGRKRLTDRQTAVLAALERLGRPTMLDLREEFPELAPSAVHAVIEALRKKGLADASGDERQRYLGGVRYWSTAISPTELPAALAALLDLIEKAAAPLDVRVDQDAKAVVLLLPLVDLADELMGRQRRSVATLRQCLGDAERSELLGGMRISTEITTDSGRQPALRLEVHPPGA